MTKDVMRRVPQNLTSEQKEQMDTVKAMGEEFYGYVDRLGWNRELSVAKTKIEEAVMWATKGITGEKN